MLKGGPAKFAGEERPFVEISNGESENLQIQNVLPPGTRQCLIDWKPGS